MIKKIALLAAILAVSAGSLFAKVVGINMNEVIASFPKTAPALESLKADLTLIQEQEKSAVAELNAKAEKLQKLVKEMESPLNSADAKEKAKAEAVELNKEILKQRQELAAAIEQAKRALQEKRNAQLAEILKEIKPIIDNYAKENGIKLVIDMSANAVVYCDPEANITEAVKALVAAPKKTEEKK